MNKLFVTLVLTVLFTSCQTEKETNLSNKINWEARETYISKLEDCVPGQSYLPVYSHIYHRFDNRIFNLTITVSIRNTSTSDSLYIINADYYNTEGTMIREYIQNPVYLKPMETIEIIIKEDDEEGGSGANFIFNWLTKEGNTPPLFEAVMISTYGQQGLSFATRGVQVF